MIHRNCKRCFIRISPSFDAVSASISYSFREPGTKTIWAGYPIDPYSQVDTMDWIGILNVAQAPYIYSWEFEGWIYVDEDSVEESNMWVYVWKQ